MTSKRTTNKGAYDYAPLDPPELVRGFDFTAANAAIKQNNAHMPSGDPEFCIEIRNRLLKEHYQNNVLDPFYDLSSQPLSDVGKDRDDHGQYRLLDYVTVMGNLHAGDYADAKEFEKDVRDIFLSSTDYFGDTSKQHLMACDVQLNFNKLFNKRKVIDDIVGVQQDSIPPGIVTGQKRILRPGVDHIADQVKSTARAKPTTSAPSASPATSVPTTGLLTDLVVRSSATPGPTGPSGTARPSGPVNHQSGAELDQAQSSSEQVDLSPGEDVHGASHNNTEVPQDREAERAEAVRGKKRAISSEGSGRGSMKRTRQNEPKPKHINDLLVNICRVIEKEVETFYDNRSYNGLDEGDAQLYFHQVPQAPAQGREAMRSFSELIKASYAMEIASEVESLVQTRVRESVVDSISMVPEEEDEDEEMEADRTRAQVKTEKR